ncbi:hypothetical protein Taro_002248 [Colocasia esculenta]|uniref:Uncharacterized protein n=1 Tax=Colocasia esculenta TaxID=4460 RepID=A0A843TI54_COLES|nr:hypothetical protein [Colocasia esculenta]
MAPCVVSNNESEYCELLYLIGCSYCCVACMVSVVAQCVRAVMVRLALVKLAVVFSVWRTVAGKSSEVLLESFSVGSGGSEDYSVLVSAVAVLPQGMRYAVVLAGAFWRVFPERCLGGSGGGSPRTGSSQNRPLSLLVEVLLRSALCSFPATVVLPLWFEVCRLVGLHSGEVLPRWLLALLVEVPPKAASCCFGYRALSGPGEECPNVLINRGICLGVLNQGVVRLAVRLAAALASLSCCSFPSFSIEPSRCSVFCVVSGAEVVVALLKLLAFHMLLLAGADVACCALSGLRLFACGFWCAANSSLVLRLCVVLVSLKADGEGDGTPSEPLGDIPPMVAMPCFRRQQLCCTCRPEKLASRSLDAGARVGVQGWTLTLAQRPGVDANKAFGQNPNYAENHAYQASIHAICTCVMSWVSDATVILVVTRMCIAFLSRLAFPSRLVVVTSQRVATAFCRFSRLTPVRVAGVSVRPVGLSRRPWRTHSCRCLLTRRVKVLNATGRSIASWGPKDKILGRRPFPPSLLFFPFPSSPVMGRFPSGDRGVVASAGSWRSGGAVSWSEEEVSCRRESPLWDLFFVKGAFEGAFGATSMLELAADWVDSRAEGKMREVRREAAAWPGCGVACVGVLLWRLCLTLPRGWSLHGGYSLAMPSFYGCHWSGLVQTRTSGDFCFGVLSIPRSRPWVLVRGGTSFSSVVFLFSEFLLLWPVRDCCPTEPVTCEAHPFFFQVKESRRVLIPLLVWDRTVVESGLHHQQSNVFTCGALGAVEDSNNMRLLPLGRLRSRKNRTRSLHLQLQKATFIWSRSPEGDSQHVASAALGEKATSKSSRSVRRHGGRRDQVYLISVHCEEECDALPVAILVATEHSLEGLRKSPLTMDSHMAAGLVVPVAT